MKFVCDESLKQTREMLQSLSCSDVCGIPSVAKDTRTLSLDVLAATGFHRSHKFRSSNQSGRDEPGSYRDALQTVLDNAILLMLISRRILQLPLPHSWAHTGRAAADFKQYIMDMLDEETNLLCQGNSGTGSLMRSFVRALDTHRKEEAALKGNEDLSSKGLTVEEIFGNIFVINLAGYNTTANTLAFSMILLEANPEVQDWVAEEVRQVARSSDSENWDYNERFSNLRRCRAVLVCMALLDPNQSKLINDTHSSRLFASIHQSWHFLSGVVTAHKYSSSAKRQYSYHRRQESCQVYSQYKRIPGTGQTLSVGNPHDGSP